MDIRFKYIVKVTHKILAENDQQAIDIAKKLQNLDAVFEVEKIGKKWWKKKKVKKCCMNCLYFNGTACSRYVMNPDLLKHPQECGHSGLYPHFEPSFKAEM